MLTLTRSDTTLHAPNIVEAVHPSGFPQCFRFFFFFYYYYSCLTPMCNRMVLTDLYFPLPTTAQSTDPFIFLHFCIISPPVLHRHGSAFGLTALLILSFIIRNTCCQVIPLLSVRPLVPFCRPICFSFPTPYLCSHQVSNQWSHRLFVC